MALLVTDEEAVDAVLAPAQSSSPIRPRFKPRKSDRALYISLGGFVLIVGACFLGPWIGHLPPPSFSNIAAANLPLGAPGHLLGTDQLGNDMLSRVLNGGRVSIVVGLGATLMGFVIGTNFGVVAGYFGGAIESILMRILDVLLAFPSLVLSMVMVAVLGPNETNEIIAISFFAIPTYARLSRATTLKVREREFVLVGRVIGAGPRHIMMRHVYSNVLPPLLTILPLTIATAMIIEASLSFLGLGVRPPTPSWGNMIAQGQSYISVNPAFIIIPAIALSVTILCLNLLGEQWRLRVSQ